MSPSPPLPLSVKLPVRGKAVRNSRANTVTIGPKIKSVVETIQRECRSPLTASQMATAIGVSRSRFEHLFHLQTGETFGAALKEARLSKAASLLAERKRSIKEIPAACGYANSHSLDRAFRKHFGRTPSAYRR
jgi:transcriptional regulator GlxA family with amidase domain